MEICCDCSLQVFSRFVAELRRLGASIVYADFQKVIIATNKVCMCVCVCSHDRLLLAC